MREKFKKLTAFFRDWDNQSSYLKWMLDKTKPFFRSLMCIFGLNVFIIVIGIGSTVVTKYIIDGVTGSGSNITQYGIIILIVIFVLSAGVSAYSGVITTYISERYAFSIRTKVYDSIVRGVWRKITSYHSGDIVTRLTSDIGSVSDGISSIIPNTLLLATRLIIAFCVLFYFDRFLALAALLLGPFGVILSLLFSGKLKEYQTELNQTESEYRAFLQETVENISVVKTFRQEDRCSDTLARLRDKRLNIVIKRNRLKMAMNLCVRAVFYLGYITAFAWSIYRLSTNSITYGTMTVFLSLVAQVQGPIIDLGNMIPQFISVLASAGRVMELDGFEAEHHGEEKIPDSAHGIGVILQNVSFGYTDETVFQNINLDIGTNEIVGIVGVSGTGKTTLACLILQLLQPDSGRLAFYDDYGTTEDASTGTRRFISYVPQGNTLISGTIADNLRAGKADATDEQMRCALHIAGCGSFVDRLENGIDTCIGENALGLSEGQAQRIGIARAVVKNAPILILDEATSALDPETEEQVLRRLKESGLLHTCIIITHRRSMLASCTRVLEIEQKKLHELQLDWNVNHK